MLVIFLSSQNLTSCNFFYTLLAAFFRDRAAISLIQEQISSVFNQFAMFLFFLFFLKKHVIETDYIKEPFHFCGFLNLCFVLLVTSLFQV